MTESLPSFADRMATARSFLFVPADRPERFEKAIASGADMVIVDLEDAVSPDRKEAARSALMAWLDPRRPVMVRINGAASPWLEGDLDLCRRPGVGGIVFPKAEDGDLLRAVASAHPVLALIESAVAVEQLSMLARVDGVVRLALGSVDLALDLDTDADDWIFDPVRLAMTVSSRAAGKAPPVDGVATAFDDPALVQAAASAARKYGFGGKLCIHPAQVPPVHRALLPDAQQVEAARRIVEAAQASNGGAVAVAGQMIDLPVIARARRTLALHHAQSLDFA